MVQLVRENGTRLKNIIGRKYLNNKLLKDGNLWNEEVSSIGF